MAFPGGATPPVVYNNSQNDDGARARLAARFQSGVRSGPAPKSLSGYPDAVGMPNNWVNDGLIAGLRRGSVVP